LDARQQNYRKQSSSVHPRDYLLRDANELFMAQADKYDYDYLKSLIHMPNGKIARGRDWVIYHLFHEAEGGGLPRDPYVA
jgi:hypothetical protein